MQQNDGDNKVWFGPGAQPDPQEGQPLRRRTKPATSNKPSVVIKDDGSGTALIFTSIPTLSTPKLNGATLSTSAKRKRSVCAIVSRRPSGAKISAPMRWRLMAKKRPAKCVQAMRVRSYSPASPAHPDRARRIAAELHNRDAVQRRLRAAAAHDRSLTAMSPVQRLSVSTCTLTGQQIMLSRG